MEGQHKKLCAVCKRAALERTRDAQRAWKERMKQDPAWVAREKERQRAAQRAMRADPERSRQNREARRMGSRLSAMRAGREIRTSPLDGTKLALRTGDLPTVPGVPLAAVVMRERERQAAGNLWDDLPSNPNERPVPGQAEAFWESLGVSERAVFAWRHRERDASLGAADIILTNLGLNWWDVWNRDAIPNDVRQFLEGDLTLFALVARRRAASTAEGAAA